MTMNINGVASFLAPGAKLAIGRIGKDGNWVLLQKLEKPEERPGYKQLRFCASELAVQLDKLDAAGMLKVENVHGLGCSVVTLNSSEA